MDSYNVERTTSLYLASAEKFKKDSLPEEADDPDPNSKKSAYKAEKGKLTELEVVQYGYQFFNKYKRLVVDMIFTRKERNQSRDFFLNRNAEDAFKVVEVELNFIYDVLYTKLPVVFRKTALGKVGVIIRFFSLATVCSAIVLFKFKNKSNFTAADVTITYGLLFGALGLDMTALIMLLFSDWIIISIRESSDSELEKSFKTKFFTAFLRLRTEGTLKDTKVDDFPRNEEELSRKWAMKLKRRWSESVPTYNLISYSLNPHWTNVIFGKLPFVSDFLDSIVHVQHKKFTPMLRNFIFEELKSKSILADDLETAKEISLARGDWVLRVEGWSGFNKYVQDVDYDRSLILWHIATELCYSAYVDDYIEHREISKLLSDYMFYLLITQPSLMSAVAGIGQIRFSDTCAEAKRFCAEAGRVFKEMREDVPLEELNYSNTFWVPERIKEVLKMNACRVILIASERQLLPERIRGNRSKSLLYDSSRDGHDHWLMISKVWVELLCYAASHSGAKVQAAQVSNGGELITLVWLLMTHFGLGEQFHSNQEQ